MAIWLISILLAATLGFAAHRASICTVRAVTEIVSTGRAYCLASFGKSILWVLAVMMPLLWFDPGTSSKLTGWEWSVWSMLGGLIFGMGAAVNGGCSFSTLARLSDGQLRMLATLAGFGIGLLFARAAADAGFPSPRGAARPLIDFLLPIAGVLSLALWIWAGLEARRLWNTRPEGHRLKDLATVHQYRLSTAAMIMGLANGFLYLVHGSWSFTGALRQGIEGVVLAGEASPVVRLTLFVAVFTGMIVSTVQRSSFHLDWKPDRTWSMNCAGGVLMGVGAKLIPGDGMSAIHLAARARPNVWHVDREVVNP